MIKTNGDSRKGFKEKVVQLYETLFRSDGDDPASVYSNYWDEFFLLRTNPTALEVAINQFHVNNLPTKTINLLVTRCIMALKDDNYIRITNSTVTLCCLTKVVLWKVRETQLDKIDILFGRDEIDLKTDILIETLHNLLTSDTTIGLKSLVLKFLLILVTTADNVNENPMMEYLMSDHLFDAFIQLLSTSQSRQSVGYQALLLLTVLVNYRKQENANPYAVKLSIVDNEVALNGYAQVVSNSLVEFKRKSDQKRSETKSTSILSTITNLVGNMFIADDEMFERENLRSSNAALLAFYEALHLNRNFITILTNSQTETYEECLASISASGEIKNNSKDIVEDLPSNLLVTFLEFCSIVMLNTKDEDNTNTSRLCFIILTNIAEDQCANAIMHDFNIVFRVHLHRMQMRHRRLLDDTLLPSRSLSFAVMDLMVEFIVTHMRKTLLLDLYTLCLGVVHRLLCYQKRNKIRCNYTWKNLWDALIALVKYVVNHESELIKKWNIFVLTHQVINILNLFITFGDTFLPSPQTYDQLYYEIIRMHVVFDNLFSLALRYTTRETSPHKDGASKLLGSLINIKAIINHFSSKIESWSSSNEVTSLNEDQVLEVIRNNYDTLTLKLQDSLDLYEPYSYDKPKETKFFADMLKTVLIDYRTCGNATVTAQEQQSLIDESLKC